MALLELQLEQRILSLDNLRKSPGRFQIVAKSLAVIDAADVDFEGGLEGWRPIDDGEAADLRREPVRLQLDGGAREVIVLPGVVVVVGDGEAQQSLELVPVELPHAVRGPVAVGEERVPAGAGGAQAVQELQAGRVLHVQQVHVQAQVLVRVRDVFRVRHRLHVPGAAVERVAEGPDARADADDGFLSGGHVGEEDEAVVVEVHQGLEEGGFGAHVRVVGKPAHVFLHSFLVPCGRLTIIVAGQDPSKSRPVSPEEPVGQCRDVVGSEARDIVLPLQLDVSVLQRRQLLDDKVFRYV